MGLGRRARIGRRDPEESREESERMIKAMEERKRRSEGKNEDES